MGPGYDWKSRYIDFVFNLSDMYLLIFDLGGNAVSS